MRVAGRLCACGDDEMVEGVDVLHDTAVGGLADLAHAHLAIEHDLRGGAGRNGEGDGARLSGPLRRGRIGRALCRQIDSGGAGAEGDGENAGAAHAERKPQEVNDTFPVICWPVLRDRPGTRAGAQRHGRR
jgi:hypothetical protein